MGLGGQYILPVIIIPKDHTLREYKKNVFMGTDRDTFFFPYCNGTHLNNCALKKIKLL